MPELTVASSNFNMPPKLAVLGNAAAHEDFLEAAGYRVGAEQNQTYKGGGFEWTDIRNPRNVLGRIALTLARQGDITSLHQSWRSTTVPKIAARLLRPRGKWNGSPDSLKNVGMELGLAATIPFIGSWVARLEPIQAAAGKKLPVVAYPNEQRPPSNPRFTFDHPSIAAQFAVLRYQPTAECLQTWGVLSSNTDAMVDDMLAVQPRYGFHEIVWDTKHAKEDRQGLRFNDPHGMLQLLARKDAIDEIHLNLSGDPASLRQALDGNLADTHHGQMLRTALGALPARRAITIVTELPAAEFTAIGVKDVAAGNKQLVQAIAAV